MVSISSSIFVYICVLLSVAFFTLLERKGLSYMQVRKGPNKVGVMGLPQPLADGIKLLIKEVVSPVVSNYSVFVFAPILSLSLALALWQLYPSLYSSTYFKWGFLFFMCISSLNVYGTLMAGWASNSKYALLGSLRAVAQTISYEVSMALIFLLPLLMGETFNLFEVLEAQGKLVFSLLLLPVSLMWFVTCLAETNRAPFDFAEGESELVSGFNIEYGSVGFVLIFLSEYANILFMGMLSSVLFLGGGLLWYFESNSLLVMSVLMFSYAFIWARASFPRYRYDLLMSLTWKVYLPISLSVMLVLVPLLLLFGA
uniref:NADH-ubiquinone oxidoreductase chain 1 n=1 Tax=Dendropoma nebulosum TaxID=170983 RepID=Q94X50_9CAEN|nr:NADH dehydrogenase subunit 1 [Dendropoma nebulosum]